MKGFLNTLDLVLDKTVLFGYDRIGYYARKPLWDDADTAVDLSGKVAVVTGANSGLGFVTARELAARNARVYLVCRSQERGEAARQKIVAETGSSDVHLSIADLSDQTALRGFVKLFSGTESRLDLLVNNAGILPVERELTVDGIESTFAVNTLAYFLMVNLLAPLLESTPGARVVNVSSGGQYLARLDVNDLQSENEKFDGTMAYARTKRAELLRSAVWAEHWRERGILVFGMHPGWADTPAVQSSLPVFRSIMQLTLRSPEEGADTIVWLCTCPRLGTGESGGFFFDRRERPMIRVESSRNSAEEVATLWRKCAELSGYLNAGADAVVPGDAAFAYAASRP